MLAIIIQGFITHYLYFFNSFEFLPPYAILKEGQLIFTEKTPKMRQENKDGKILLLVWEKLELW